MENIKYEKLTLELEQDSFEQYYKIVSCEKDAVVVNIPKAINDIVVRKIDDYAFEDCVDLAVVNFPEYDIEDRINDVFLKEIGEYAFKCCTSLIEMELPYTLYSIKWGAFSGCTSLVKCTFDSFTFVGSYAFYNCKSLVELSYFTNASEGVCSGCELLPYLPLTNSTREISEDAFEHCYALKEIVLPASIERIEKLAFRSCRNLKSVTFEATNNWYWHNRYQQTDHPLNVSNPTKNAQMLSGMDFDDGVGTIYRK